MKLFAAVLFFLPTFVASGGSDPSLEDIAAERAIRARRRAVLKKSCPGCEAIQEAPCVRCETVEVVFHILGNAAGTSDAATLWTDENIQGEIANLNEKWSNTPFQFVHQTTTRHFRDDWASGDGTADWFADSIAAELRIGGRTTANVFVNDGNICSVSGYSKSAFSANMWPVDQFSKADHIFLCGKVVHTNNPDILTHELGHWFG
jgi:hypothetical protein